MNKIRMVIFAIVGLSILSMAVVIAGQHARLKDSAHEIETARAEIDTLNARIESTNADMLRMKSDIEAASKRLDAAISAMTKGERDARERHETRMDEVTKLDAQPDAHDWLCEPVPDDVCMLFEDYTGPVLSD